MTPQADPRIIDHMIALAIFWKATVLVSALAIQTLFPLFVAYARESINRHPRSKARKRRQIGARIAPPLTEASHR